MTQELTTPGASASGAVSETTPTVTRALLVCGVVAGPLYVVVALLQVLFRDGFDLGRHPLSLLSLGELGWIQITNFIVGGLLAVGFARFTSNIRTSVIRSRRRMSCWPPGRCKPRWRA